MKLLVGYMQNPTTVNSKELFGNKANPQDVPSYSPSKIEWDLTNGPPSKLLELLDTQV